MGCVDDCNLAVSRYQRKGGKQAHGPSTYDKNLGGLLHAGHQLQSWSPSYHPYLIWCESGLSQGQFPREPSTLFYLMCTFIL